MFSIISGRDIWYDCITNDGAPQDYKPAYNFIK